MTRVCVVFQSQASVVKRDAPSANSVLDDLQKHGQELATAFAEQFKSFTSSKNAEDFQKSLKTGADSLGTQITALAGSLQGAVSTLLTTILPIHSLLITVR